jgi:hypothetical protein
MNGEHDYAKQLPLLGSAVGLRVAADASIAQNTQAADYALIVQIGKSMMLKFKAYSLNTDRKQKALVRE